MNNYEVIISRLGVPFLSVEVEADSAEIAAYGVEQSREGVSHEYGDTYDAVELVDTQDLGVDFAYTHMKVAYEFGWTRAYRKAYEASV